MLAMVKWVIWDTNKKGWSCPSRWSLYLSLALCIDHLETDTDVLGWSQLDWNLTHHKIQNYELLKLIWRKRKDGAGWIATWLTTRSGLSWRARLVAMMASWYSPEWKSNKAFLLFGVLPSNNHKLALNQDHLLCAWCWQGREGGRPSSSWERDRGSAVHIPRPERGWL